MIKDILQDPLVITLIASGIGVVIISIFLLLSSSKSVKSRLDTFVGSTTDEDTPRISPTTESVLKVRTSISDFFSSFAPEKLRARISYAHWPISAGEYLLIQIVSTALAFVIGWVIPRNIIGGIGLAMIVVFLPGIFLTRSIDVRRQKFSNQLLDALILIRGAVQSGYSLLQAMDLVKDEMPSPSAEEYGRVVREVQIGLPLPQALLNLSSRMENDDLYMVVTAIIINSQVGGNLSTMLNAVTNTIRARIFMYSEVRALTSYARYTGYLLTLMPFVAGVAIYILNPSYFAIIPASLVSQIILVVAFIMLIIGNIWIRRIVQIKY